MWETGLFETIGQLLRRAWQGVRGVTRDIFDVTTDPIVQELVRALYGPQIWSGMKRSAERAVAEEGGTLYVARKLKAFCDQHQQEGPIELHAVGHSAGSIFHAHFLPTVCDLGVRRFVASISWPRHCAQTRSSRGSCRAWGTAWSHWRCLP